VPVEGLAADSGASVSGETRVELEFLEGQRNDRLIFGRPEAVFHRDHHFGITKRVAIFRPGARFALELWEGKVVLNRSRKPVARTHRWRILVLEAGRADAHVCRVPNVEPGAHVLMEATRTKTCLLLKAWLAELEEQGDPANLPREFFLARDLRLQALWRGNGLRRSGSYVDASSH
jgi:hypothetical protein